MSFFNRPQVRRFGVNADNGAITATFRGKTKELGFSPSGIKHAEVMRRWEGLQGKGVIPLPGKRYDTDVIARTATGDKVTAAQIEGVYNDYLLIDALCGMGTYAYYASVHELAVLEIAKGMF